MNTRHSSTLATDSAQSGCLRPRPFSSQSGDLLDFLDALEQAQDPTAVQEARWQLAAEAVSNYSAIQERFERRGSIELDSFEYSIYDPLVEELVVSSAANWPIKDIV